MDPVLIWFGPGALAIEGVGRGSQFITVWARETGFIRVFVYYLEKCFEVFFSTRSHQGDARLRTEPVPEYSNSSLKQDNDMKAWLEEGKVNYTVIMHFT